MTPDVFLTGASGLVGSRFVEKYGDKYEFKCLEFPEFDLTKPDEVKKKIKKYNPKVLINFAAFTDVNKAEEQREDKNGLCWRINVDGVRALIESMDPNSLFGHISTDMALEGNGPFNERILPGKNLDKLTWYGFAKAWGERILLAHKKNKIALIRIIYPDKAGNTVEKDGKLGYLHGFLKKFDDGKLKDAFAEQYISLTSIDEFCDALAKIIDDNLTGVFHIATSDTGSPYEIVSYLLEVARGKTNAINKGSLQKLVDDGILKPYRYAVYGGLDVKQTEKRLKMTFGTWHEIIDEMIRQETS